MAPATGVMLRTMGDAGAGAPDRISGTEKALRARATASLRAEMPSRSPGLSWVPGQLEPH